MEVLALLLSNKKFFETVVNIGKESSESEILKFFENEPLFNITVIEEEREVEQEDEEEVLRYHKIKITQEDLARLEPDQELNDIIIDFYISFIMNERLDSQFGVHCFNTALWYIWMRNPERFAQSFDENIRIFTKEFVLVPICEDNHWFMNVICYPDALISKI